MKFLVIEKYSQMNHSIDNVIIVTCDTKEEAIDLAARKLQRSRYTLFAFNIDEMEESWQYYESI